MSGTSDALIRIVPLGHPSNATLDVPEGSQRWSVCQVEGFTLCFWRGIGELFCGNYNALLLYVFCVHFPSSSLRKYRRSSRIQAHNKYCSVLVQHICPKSIAKSTTRYSEVQLGPSKCPYRNVLRTSNVSSLVMIYSHEAVLKAVAPPGQWRTLRCHCPNHRRLDARSEHTNCKGYK